MNTQMKTLMSQHIFNPSICRILFATCLSALCFIALSTQAATITVTNTNDSGAGSLRQAIADANDGDTIDFGVTGTITLTTGHLLVAKNITISGPGATNLAVNGNAASRVFYIGWYPGFNNIVTISGLTITNGRVSIEYGGGIYNNRSTLTLNNCIVSGNSAVGNDGGGIFNDHATLTVSNCTVSGNSSYSSGGGICSDALAGSATVTINNSTLSSNSAFAGGGLFNEGFTGSPTMTVHNSTLSGNSAYAGGAIYNNGSLSGNPTVTIANSTLSGNSARFAGGIYNAGSSGGSTTVTIEDTVLKTGDSGENVFNYLGTVTSLGYNISSDDGGGFLASLGDQVNTDPMLGPLQDNGGPTFTHALLSGSPAIDAGDPSFTPPPNYDQRGSDFQRVFNGRVDIGAFEVQPPRPAYTGQVQAPINPDGSSTFNVRRGVVPVKFNLTLGGVATCDLPPATIAVTRTAGGVIGQVNESDYSGNADTGSNFRIDSCQYVYNLNSSALGVGTYRVDILIGGQVVGSATFGLN